MITESEIRQTLAALRYLHRLRLGSDPTYAGSCLAKDAENGIAALKELNDRMRDSDRSDFLGGEI
ncbi:hypothetical protein P1A145kb_p148 [Pectobacterium phage DU_PP_I]|nr:hypothetical protein P1A145kb_p148 [Pectobacterium phage DU_PP_I]ATS93865.1 hypothetical protein P12B145kb_p149 [Pectobacterium phage DU_PP_IV]